MYRPDDELAFILKYENVAWYSPRDCSQLLYSFSILMALLASCDTRPQYGFGYTAENPALFPISYAA